MNDATKETTKALAKPASKTVVLRDYLEARRKTLAEVLPRHLTPERIIKVALAAFSKTPKLQECTIESVAQSVMMAGELGLEAGGALGHAYLVPYGNACTLIVGYRGLIRLARQSGEIDSIEAHPVYEKDKFKLRYGLQQELEHEPYLAGDPGPLLFVYAVARLRDGGTQLEVMTKAQVDKIRGMAKGGNSKAWSDSYDEMARKTVVRRLCKYLPLSPEKAEPLARALEVEDQQPAIDVQSQPTEGSRTDEVLSVLKRAKTVQERAEAADAGRATDAEIVTEYPAAAGAAPEPGAGG